MKTYSINLSPLVKPPGSEAFARWLEKQGHDVTIGTRIHTHVDGFSTHEDRDALDIMNGLWRGYVNNKT